MTAAPPASTEEVLALDCEGERLFGILHLPAAGGTNVASGVVIVVGGPQYRAGSHRQFVQLARALAAAGHPVLRFDVRGMGDSSGDMVTFEQMSADVRAAIDALSVRVPALDGVVLWGLCDGASASLLYLDEQRDPRVRGVCLANPWVRSADSHAKTTLRHYYARRILQPEFWRKLLRGQVAASAVRELKGHVRNARSSAGSSDSAPFHQRMLRGLKSFDGKVLLFLSGQDLTACEFVDRTRSDRHWQAALGRSTVTRSELPDADHTFSSPEARLAVETATVRWLASWSRLP